MRYYCITDPVEIRIMILYALQVAKEPLARPQITHALLASADVDMFDICDAMAFLEKANEIFRYVDSTGREVMDLTDGGKISAKCFGDDLPLQVREYIIAALKELYQFTETQKRLVAKTVPVNYTDYCAQLSLREAEEDLLSMSVYAQDKKIADLMCKNFKKKHAEIYEYLIKTLTEEE